MNEFLFINMVENDLPENEEVLFQSSLVQEETIPDKDLFSGDETGFRFTSFSPTISNSGKTVMLQGKNEEYRISFEMNISIWNDQTSLLANNNFDNSYFKEIVKMGEDAVPLIFEKLKKGATPLVHALDLIYPGTIEYEGYIPLGAICSLWEDILTQKGFK